MTRFTDIDPKRRILEEGMGKDILTDVLGRQKKTERSMAKAITKVNRSFHRPRRKGEPRDIL